MQGQDLHRPGSQESLLRRHRAWACLPFLAAGQTHVSAGPYQKVVEFGHLLAHESSEARRRSVGRRRAADVFAWAGGHRAVRRLRHEQRQERRHGGPEGDQLHSVGAEHEDRRLALSSGRRGRHVGRRLAVDGAQERPDGRPERQSGRARRHQALADVGRQGSRQRHQGAGGGSSRISPTAARRRRCRPSACSAVNICMPGGKIP